MYIERIYHIYILCGVMIGYLIRNKLNFFSHQVFLSGLYIVHVIYKTFVYRISAFFWRIYRSSIYLCILCIYIYIYQSAYKWCDKKFWCRSRFRRFLLENGADKQHFRVWEKMMIVSITFCVPLKNDRFDVFFFCFLFSRFLLLYLIRSSLKVIFKSSKTKLCAQFNTMCLQFF